jgi:hypothetical protein
MSDELSQSVFYNKIKVYTNFDHLFRCNYFSLLEGFSKIDKNHWVLTECPMIFFD